MNKTYTLKELADIGAKAANLQHTMGIIAREEFTKAILDTIGYEFPKDEEREAFEEWWSTINHYPGDDDEVFAVWKAGREELRREQMMAKEPPELVEKPLTDYGEVKTEPAWIPWSGGECPLSDGVEWEAKFRSGTLFKGEGRACRWNHLGSGGDIVAYRVIQ